MLLKNVLGYVLFDANVSPSTTSQIIKKVEPKQIGFIL